MAFCFGRTSGDIAPVVASVEAPAFENATIRKTIAPAAGEILARLL
jgi:hypothetical protein